MKMIKPIMDHFLLKWAYLGWLSEHDYSKDASWLDQWHLWAYSTIVKILYDSNDRPTSHQLHRWKFWNFEALVIYYFDFARAVGYYLA